MRGIRERVVGIACTAHAHNQRGALIVDMCLLQLSSKLAEVELKQKCSFVQMAGIQVWGRVGNT